MASYEVLFTSKIFRFLVGPERKEFTIHSSAISRLSAPLDSLINGNMAEAREGVVVWDDMDPETFIRLCEFAYRDDYTTPLLESRAEPYQYTYEQLSPSDQEMYWYDDPDYKRWIDFRPDEIRDGYHRNIQGWVLGPYDTPGPTFYPEENEDEGLDYRKLLLCHVQLYIIGDKYFINDLKALTIYKLHRTLLGFPEFYEPLQDVVDVIRFTYENTIRGDKLRMLLSHFMSIGFKANKTHPMVRQLLEEVAEFTYDVAEHLDNSVLELEGEIEEAKRID